MKYVLITPARNEERFIAKTLESMVAQTLLPERWVIVDDGSTDNTAEIVARYAARYPWIELVQRPQHVDRSFAGKVHAFNAGLERVSSLDFEVIGNLDADLSFESGLLGVFNAKDSQKIQSLVLLEHHLPKMAVTIPQRTALKVKTMLLVDVSSFVGSVLKRLAAMFQTAPVAWTGLP